MGKKVEKNIMSTIVKYAVASIDENGQPSFGETQEVRLDGRREEETAQNIIKRDYDKRAVVLSCETVVQRFSLPLETFLEHATIVENEEQTA